MEITAWTSDFDAVDPNELADVLESAGYVVARVRVVDREHPSRKKDWPMKLRNVKAPQYEEEW